MDGNVIICSCGEKLIVPSSAIGKVGRCPKCRNTIKLLPEVTPPQILADHEPSVLSRLRKKRGGRWVSIAMFVMLAGIVASAWTYRTDIVSAFNSISHPPSEAKLAVLKYFNDNLNDPDFEEIEWREAVLPDEVLQDDIERLELMLATLADQLKELVEELKKIRAEKLDSFFKADRISEMDELSNQISKAGNEIILHLNALKQLKEYRVCRIRYRARNAFNALMIYDDMFLMMNGEPVEVSEENAFDLRLNVEARKILSR